MTFTLWTDYSFPFQKLYQPNCMAVSNSHASLKARR